MSATHHYVYWLRGAKFVEIAAFSVASIRKVDPHAHFYAWTDEPKTTPDLPDAMNFRLEPGRPAMVANLDAQLAALNYLPQGSRVLFLDADTLLRKPFPWSHVPDMYVTWRDKAHGIHGPQEDPDFIRCQPYNYGVVGCHVRPPTLEAFYWLRHRVLNMAPVRQLWYGNQLALADLVGSPPTEGQADKDVRVRWSLTDRGTPLCVRQLPCDIWNHSPDSADEDVSRCGLLHLKGERKDLLKHYAEVA